MPKRTPLRSAALERGGPVWTETPTERPLPQAWASVQSVLDGAVAQGAAAGADESWCVIALDVAEQPQLCAGSGADTYSASLVKIAVGAAAIEAYGGDVEADVTEQLRQVAGGALEATGSGGEGGDDSTAVAAADPAGRGEADAGDDASDSGAADWTEPDDAGFDDDSGFAGVPDAAHVTLGELVISAVSYSDNEAFNALIDLIGTRPAAARMGPFAYVNAMTARVGLADEFHVGNYFDIIVGDGWNHLTASGAARFVAALVEAADGDVAPAQLDSVRPGTMTTPRAARAVLTAMAQQTRRIKLPAQLPTEAVANKTGETDTESHDLAVIGTAAGRIAVAVIASFPDGTAPPDADYGPAAAQIVSLLGGPAAL